MFDARAAARSGIPPSQNRLSQRFAESAPTGGRSPADELLDDFFAGNKGSFRECYAAITGDKRVTGRAEDVNFDRMAAMTRFTEAVDITTFSDILGAALHRALLPNYSQQIENTRVWKAIAKPGRLQDFRTHEAVRMGGYGTLATVAEGGPYLAVTSPPDEKVGYAATKRGGTESITLEAIRNDDVGLIREVPKRLALAAARTLASFALDFLRTNPVIYDGTDLFHASHGNLGSSALSAVSLYAAFVAMRKQPRYGTTERLDLRGKYLLVPYELEEGAYNMLVRNTNNDRFYIQEQRIEVVPVYDWTDATDWVLAADPNLYHGIEIGFLDGHQDPDLFVQDLPNSGSLFSNDKITIKIRHIYGGAVIDYRPFYKSVVAG